MAMSSRKRQKNLFTEPEAGREWLERPPLNPRPRLKEAIRQTLDGSPYSRPQIAERMNRAFQAEGLGNRVTGARIDSWAADSKPALPETVEVPVFCWAAGSALALAALNACLKLRLVTAQEGRRLDLARMEDESKRLAQEVRRRRQELEER